MRLDKFLCKKYDISFALAQKIIREKKVKVNDRRVDASYKVDESDKIRLFEKLPNRHVKVKNRPKISTSKRQKFLSSVIFEDDNLIAIDKSSGLATQGGTAIDISVNDFLFGSEMQLVHRLDKDTSGVLLIAKNAKSAEFLTELFKNKLIEKTYLALVNGVLKKKEGKINIPLKKQLLGKNEKVRPNFSEGKEAVSNFKLIKNFSDYALLELKPLTGRTHQLRVHCKEIGHPILNDVKYGGKLVLRKDICKRLCLHAHEIKIANYFGRELKISSKLPEFIKE